MNLQSIAFKSESELCIAFMEHMRSLDYKVYPEVRGIDLIITKADKIYGIQAKQKLNVQVLEQAHGCRQYFNAVYCLVPHPNPLGYSWLLKKDRRIRNFLYEVAHAMNIGIYGCSKTAMCEWTSLDQEIVEDPMIKVDVLVPTKDEYIKDNDLLKYLVPEAEVHTAPGLPSPHHFSKTQLSEIQYIEFIKSKNGSCSLMELLTHFYPPGIHKVTGKPRRIHKHIIEFQSWWISTKMKRIIFNRTGKSIEDVTLSIAS
jgi:hypothetical protein